MRIIGWVAFGVVSSLYTVAWAQQARPAPPPKPPVGQQVPMTQVACLPESDTLELRSLKGEPVVCWSATSCMKLSGRDPAEMVATPPERPASIGPRAEVKTQGGKEMVCLAADCKPVGPKLGAAITAARKEAAANGETLWVGATADRKAVVFAGGAWSLAADKPLVFKKPSSYSAKDDTPSVVGVQVVGNLLVVSWSNCAGPCTVDQVVDSGGKNKGKSVAGGGGAFQLDATKFVVVSEYLELNVFDVKGKHLGGIEFPGVDPSAGQAAALDEITIGVLRADGDDAMRLITVTILDDGTPTLMSERFLPKCP